MKIRDLIDRWFSNSFKKISSIAVILTGCGIAIYLRVLGCHLTEGELFVEYLPLWILAAVLMVGGYFVFKDTD